MLQTLWTRLRDALGAQSKTHIVHPDNPVTELAFLNPWDTQVHGKYFCDCCGYNTLDSKWEFEICPVCFWEDNVHAYEEPDVIHYNPNHSTSLMRARHNYARIGCYHPDYAHDVRQALPEEIHHIFDDFPQFAITANGKYFCPCCAYNTLLQESQYHHCEICFWEDDPAQQAHPRAFGRNPHTLFQARLNFEQYGASDTKMQAFVRQPTATDCRNLAILKDQDTTTDK